LKNKEVVKLKVYENWLKKGNNNNKIIKMLLVLAMSKKNLVELKEGNWTLK
jgi:hypothetical protein